ncbi:MAG: ABC transporter ATP-binding protein [Spirochaetales bacterium]
MESVHLSDVFKIFKEAEIETVALKGASLNVGKGESVAIMGRSGSGKSTMLSIISGLSLPNAGKVHVDGTDITAMTERERAEFRLNKIGIIYQYGNLVPFLTALENVMVPLTLPGGSAARPAEARRAALDLLARMGLSERASHLPERLSGGEKQRVAIAVAIANNPEILLADEPTGELDSVTTETIMDLLTGLNSDKSMTLVIVTHNARVAERAGRRIVIADGRFAQGEKNHD